MLRKGHDGLYKSPEKEERMQKAKRRERDQIKLIDLTLEYFRFCAMVDKSHLSTSINVAHPKVQILIKILATLALFFKYLCV